MAFSTHDTIVAVATPPGRGGIGVVRVSGAAAVEIARQLVTHSGPLESRRATLTRLRVAAALGVAATQASLRRSAPSDSCPSVQPHPSIVVDQAVATFFPAPHSYTGEDVVELSAHGSPVVLRMVIESAIVAGARMAEPGEFTLRAFLNGRIDLTQAEAVGDLIDSVTPLQARAAFDQLEGTLTREIADLDAALFDLIARLEASVDFPDEGYHFITPDDAGAAIAALCGRTAGLLAGARRGRLIREGFQVAIVGAPNVGKSSLFNALVGSPRAIVADLPGTTRDLVTESVDVEGVRVTLIDTAGLRDSLDAIEAEGVARSVKAQTVADLVLRVVDEQPVIVDGGRVRSIETKSFVVQNKIDRTALRRDDADAHVSAKTGEGIDSLRRRIVAAMVLPDGATAADAFVDRPEITNVRHAALLQQAHEALTHARDAARTEGGALSEEFLLADLQEARAALEEIAGRRASDDLITHIFSRFCIGK